MNRIGYSTWRPLGVSVAMALLLLTAVWLGVAGVAFAQEGPEVDAAAGINVTTLNPGVAADGQCSLIEAIDNANADAAIHADCPAGTGADTISLQADALYFLTSVNNTVDGANGLPSITGTLTILGNGASIIRNTTVSPPDFRLFQVAATGRLTLDSVNLRNGRVDPTGTNQLLLGGGAILNRGELTIRGGSISFNHAGFGGAIYHAAISSTLAITGTTFSFNTANTAGGGLYLYGPATLAGVTLQNNTAASAGGGILHSSAPLSLSTSTLRRNHADQGGGLAVYAATGNSQVTVAGSSFVSNTAVIAGGGLLNVADNGYTATMHVDTSVFSLNVVTGTAIGEGWGGGLVNGFFVGEGGGAAYLTVARTTVGENLAKLGGGIANLDAAGYVTRSVALTLTQSTVAGNVAQGEGVVAGTGGGLFTANATATVMNSTVTLNLAQGQDVDFSGRGGGIAAATQGMATTLTLLNTTLTDNEATGGGGLASLGIVTGTSASVSLGNTLVQNNKLVAATPITDTDGITDTDDLTDVVQLAATTVITDAVGCLAEGGTVTSLGYNAEDGDTCNLTATGDRPDTPVALQPLAFNGGPTQTYVPLQTSAAYNGGSITICALVGNVDQRGVIRPDGLNCDIGSVERAQDFWLTLFPQMVLRYQVP